MTVIISDEDKQSGYLRIHKHALRALAGHDASLTHDEAEYLANWSFDHLTRQQIRSLGLQDLAVLTVQK